jgi:hypothetical protein
MSENDALVMATYNAMAANLEVIYSNNVTDLPPVKYCQTLSWALWNNDPKLLMKVLDGEDINPWDISFVEDGLGDGSPDMQSMIEFAARKKSWACVAELVQHYMDCGEGVAIYGTTGPAMFEYEAATDPARIDFLETMLRSANVGYAKHLASRGSIGAAMVFQPAYSSACPKATRFIFKDFSAIKFSCKGIGPIADKRLALRQKTLAAISAGDCVGLASALDFLNANANAMAQQASKRLPQDALNPSEIETFTGGALGCGYPQCVNAILSKIVEFQKAKSTAKLAGKKINEEQLKLLTGADTVNLLNKILYVVKIVDHQCNGTKSAPPAAIEAAVEKTFFAILSETERRYIDKVKSKCEEGLTAMQACVNQACAHAESRIEEQEIAAAMSENDQPVSAPREKVRGWL